MTFIDELWAEAEQADAKKLIEINKLRADQLLIEFLIGASGRGRDFNSRPPVLLLLSSSRLNLLTLPVNTFNVG